MVDFFLNVFPKIYVTFLAPIFEWNKTMDIFIKVESKKKILLLLLPVL